MGFYHLPINPIPLSTHCSPLVGDSRSAGAKPCFAKPLPHPLEGGGVSALLRAER